jgi:hypothetical protein
MLNAPKLSSSATLRQRGAFRIARTSADPVCRAFARQATDQGSGYRHPRFPAGILKHEFLSGLDILPAINGG